MHFREPLRWLPEGKSAAVVFSIDDVHPGRSTDAYEAGGDLGDGALGRLERLMGLCADARCTLFVTARWRQIAPAPTRRWAAQVPLLRQIVFHSRVLPEMAMALRRHPTFVEYLESLPRVDCGLHGLHHVQRGPQYNREFSGLSERAGAARIRAALREFEAAGLPATLGIQPPCWWCDANLVRAAAAEGLRFVVSARDLETDVSAGALAQGSGLRDVPLFAPSVATEMPLVHFPVNFQATSSPERAFEILEMGGLLSIKAHIVEGYGEYRVLDALNDEYCAKLSAMFEEIEKRFGDRIWWPSMDEIAQRVLGTGESR